MKREFKLGILLLCLSILPVITNIKNNNSDVIDNYEPIGTIALQNYTMFLDTSFEWINITGSTSHFMFHDDYEYISLPFNFPIYENNLSNIRISSNSIALSFYDIPYTIYDFPNNDNELTIAAFNKEINLSNYMIYTKSLSAPNRFAVIFENITYWDSGDEFGSAEIILYEDGMIKIQYKNIENMEDNSFMGINRGLELGYYSSYDNLNDSMDEYAIDFVYGPNLYPPQLSDWAIESGDSHQDDIITYTVNYTDLDNHPAQNVNITINGTTYSMYRQNNTDFDYTDGCVYVYSTILQPGEYNYSFGCYDGDYFYETSTFVGPIITKSNLHQPTLDLISSPTSGYVNSTEFEFIVRYKDDDNNAPEFVSINFNGINYEMNELYEYEKNYIYGKQYVFTSNSTIGGYNNYTIFCSDGDFTTKVGPYYEPYLLPRFEDYNTTDLTGFNIGALSYYGGTNSILKYPDLVADLEYRGATLTEIATELTESLLDGYDMLWIDEHFEGYISFSYEILDDWVYNKGGTLLITGVQFGGLRTSIIQHYGMAHNSNSWGSTQTTNFIYNHPITTDVSEFMIEEIGDININNQPNAFEFIKDRWDEFTIGVATPLEKGGLVIIADSDCFTTHLYDSNNSLVANNTFGWLHSLNNSNFNKPELKDASLNPSSGSQSTPFIFSVNYTDADNYGPTFMSVVINDTSYMMYKKNLTDNNFTDGCIYEYVKYLPSSIYPYEYYFICSDGVQVNTTETFSGPTVSYSNSFTPTLADADVTPEEGESDYTLFEFSVNYTDLDNNIPMINITLNGINHTMAKLDGMDDFFIDGCIYVYSTTLKGIKTHEFNITAFDGENYVFDGTFNNPETNDTTGPELGNETITPQYSSDGTIFNFTIDVWDSTGIDSVNGYIYNISQNLIDSVVFYDDGNHNDGAALDGTYGASYDSTGLITNPYAIYVNATDTTPENNVGWSDMLGFVVMDMNLELDKLYHYYILNYMGSTAYEGSHFVSNATDIEVIVEPYNVELSILGDLYLWNKTSGLLEFMQSDEIETYDFITKLYDDAMFPFVFEFLVLPIDLEKINESICLMVGEEFVQESAIYEENNTVYVLTSGMSETGYTVQWNDQGILNYSYFTMDGSAILEFYLIEDDTSAPSVSNANIFPYLPSLQGTIFNVTADVTDQSGIKNITAIIHYPDLVTNETIQMYDDGLHNDGIPMDGNFGFIWDSTGKPLGDYNISMNATDNKDYNQLYENILNFTVTIMDTAHPIITDKFQSSYAEGIVDIVYFTYAVELWDTSAISKVISYLKDEEGNVIASYPLFDDGMHNDFSPDDGIFGTNFTTEGLIFGHYCIDIFSNDTSSNENNQSNVISFSIIDWTFDYGDVAEYIVTKNTLAFYSMQFSDMPVGYMFRTDIFKENITGSLSTIWGNSYYLDDEYNWIQKGNMIEIGLLNATFDYYDCHVMETAYTPIIIPLIIPSPVNSDTLRWLINSYGFQDDFDDSGITFGITENSITVYEGGAEAVYLEYNEQGFLTKYRYRYVGLFIFEFELVVLGNTENDGVISNIESEIENVNTVTFSLDYSQEDGINPFYVNISINGTIYQMDKNEIWDYDYINGVGYNLTLELANGTYVYYFQYYDGYKIITTQEYTIKIGEKSDPGNNPPENPGDDPKDYLIYYIIIGSVVGVITISSSVMIIRKRKKRISPTLSSIQNDVSNNQFEPENPKDIKDIDDYLWENRDS